jgi:hypothetical protein
VIAAEISADIGPLIEQLEGLGLRIEGWRYDAKTFGNFYVDFTGPNGSFRIIRDRSQYILDGDISRLKELGLFRAFDSRDDFGVAVLSFAQSVV